MEQAIFNVKDFGAKGDGRANDMKAFQKAINACDTAGGGAVFIPEGIYTIKYSLWQRFKMWITKIFMQMKKFYGIANLCLLIFFTVLFGIQCTQGQSLSFPQNPADFNRPGAGANEWTGGQNIINIPNQGINTQRLDKYWRFTWLDFQNANSASGAYDFSVFDAQIQQAIKLGQSFSFGIMQQCGGCDANQQTNVSGSKMLYPTWLHNQMQSESTKDFTSGGEWFPNYNSPSYLTAWKNLNVALNAHIMSGSYNGVRYQDVIGQIDIRGYGDYGEWTNNVFTVGNITVATGDSIISYVVHTFDKFQCVYMMATCDGGQLSSNTNVPPGVGYYALTTSNSVGKLGWRRDSWGQTDGYLSQWTDTNPTTFNGLSFKTEIMNRYQKAPIVGEPQDGGSAGTFNSLSAQMLKYGVTSFGNGNFNTSSNGSNATVQTNFRAASAAAGYKLTITAGSISGNLISLTWSNINTAPDYKDWNVNFELRNGSVVAWTKKSSFSPKFFLKGSITVIDSLPNGTGDLYLVIRDPLNFRKPMPLAITGQNADGSYLLKSAVTLSGGGVIQPPPPVDTTVIPKPPVDTTVIPIPPINCDTIIKVPVKTPVYKTRTVIDTTYTITTKDSTVHRTCPGTPIPPTTSPTTVFATQFPSGSVQRDNTTGIEVGMKFTSSIAGSIIGVRFYKQPGNSGTHTGELYSSTGTRLASAVFANDTTSGWKTVAFTSPVAITVGTTYVVACFSSAGFYSSDNTGFKVPIVNGPLTGTIGVYTYTTAPALPGSKYQTSNYWVDGIFVPNGLTTPK